MPIRVGRNAEIVTRCYDALNRPELLRHFKDKGGSANQQYVYDEGLDQFLAQYDYTLALDGKRTGAMERVNHHGTFWTEPQVTQIDWFYDALGRLTGEAYDCEYHTAYEDLDLRYIADYTYDLVGNRLKKRTDADPSSADLAFARSNPQSPIPNPDEAIDYVYDANDRLLTEAKDDLTAADEDRFTVYGYGPGNSGTQQTSKTVHEGSNDAGDVLEETTYHYNLQGRLEETTIDADGDGDDPEAVTVTEYEYDDAGIRVMQRDGTVETVYLYDANNPTGLPQILEENIQPGSISDRKTYTLGLDVLAQDAYYLLYDGHGSTRCLVYVDGSLYSGQLFRYDAFGNRLDSVTDPLTQLLYSGELTDPTGLQYLRARYYDPSVGRFNRLDPLNPFAVNLRDPQSLHKYLYCQANPVMGIDPSGFLTLGGSQPLLSEESYKFKTIDDLIETLTLERNTILPYLQQAMTEGIGLAAAASRYALAMSEFFMDYVAFDDPMQMALGWIGARACFIEGTKIVVGVNEHGEYQTKPIEELQEGDLVLSRDQYDVNAEVKLRPITVVRKITNDHVREVTIRDSADREMAIHTTDHHPFWVEGQGWTPANDLKVGERLNELSGVNDVTVVATRRDSYADGIMVYNFEVAEDHTYFVSDIEGVSSLAIWVHNACILKSFQHKPTGRIRQVIAVVGLNAKGLLDAGKPTNNTARKMIKDVKGALDEAGHLLGKRLGGTIEGNIVPMLRSLNRGDYRVFEKKIADYMVAHGVEAMIKITPKYIRNSLRPFKIVYLVKFSDGTGLIKSFKNPLK